VARPGRLALGGGLAAAAIAVVVGLTLAAPPAGRGGPNAAPTGNTPALLLAAASRVEAGTAATPGRYWLGGSRTGWLVQVGPATDRYRLLVQSQVELWLSTVPGDQQGLVNRPLGAAPATASDRAAWRRDGARTQWTVESGLGKGTVLYASGGPLTSMVGASTGWSFVTGGDNLTTAQLLSLPSTPAALRAHLVGMFNDLHDPLADGGLDTYLYDAGTQILTELPTTPALRGAAYRMLAQLPDVRDLGPLTVEPWFRPGWYAGASAYLDRMAAGRGWVRTGPVEQVKHWSMSSVLRAQTDGGRLYLKAILPELAHEPAVIELLARSRPDAVPRVLAHDPAEHRWVAADFVPDLVPLPTGTGARPGLIPQR
jgi:hypothetical protein